jgi:Na+/melibiose symporter-like transporter
VNREAQTLGIWSLVLGVLGIFCCVGVGGIVAIVLGLRSNRLAQNGFATAGIVLGIIGIIELLVAVGLGLLGYFVERSESLDTTALAPVLHCAVPLVRPFLGL